MNKSKKCTICGEIVGAMSGNGRSYIEAPASIEGLAGVYICKGCIDNGHRLLSTNLEKEEKKPAKKRKGHNALSKISSPQDIYSLLSKRVVGQEQYKKRMSLFGYNHLKRIDAFRNNIPLSQLPAKTSLLAIGPTGTGKTHLLTVLCEILGVPSVIADATALTESGFSGGDVEDVLKNLINAAGGSKERAEIEGIICIDEIDKLCSQNRTNSSEISREGVQMRFLKIIEGQKDISLNIRNASSKSYDLFDTSMVSFVAAGAFSGINLITSEKDVIGFRGKNCKTEREDSSYRLPDDPDLINNALVKYGLLPELVSRLNLKVVLVPLSVENMIDILEKTDDSIIKREIEDFKREGIELSVYDGVARKIAERAFTRKQGARGLTSVFQDLMYETKFQNFGKKGLIDRVVIKVDEGGHIIAEEENDVRIARNSVMSV